MTSGFQAACNRPERPPRNLNDGYDPEVIELLVEPEFRSDEALALHDEQLSARM
jgi:hypothetical protein